MWFYLCVMPGRLRYGLPVALLITAGSAFVSIISLLFVRSLPEQKAEFIILIIEEADNAKKYHSHAHIAVGDVECRKIDGNEIDEVHYITIFYPIYQIPDSSVYNKKKGEAHDMEPLSFRNLKIFPNDEEHNAGCQGDKKSLFAEKGAERRSGIFQIRKFQYAWKQCEIRLPF